MNAPIKKISAILLLVLLSLLACNNKGSDGTASKIVVDTVEVLEMKEKMDPIISNLDTTLWTEIQPGQNNILIDMRYASTDNFMNKEVYPCGRCFLRPIVAEKVFSIADKLAQQKFRLKIFDCYRPAQFQHELWKVKPDWRYVTPPKKGSMHSRGLGIDLTLCDMGGNELDMGVPYDYFGKKARHDYVDFPAEILINRHTLKTAMTEAGFTAGRSEWWHYSLPRKFPLDSIVWNCN